MGPRFYCLGARTGDEIWRFHDEEIWTTNASPTIAGGSRVMTVFEAGRMPSAPWILFWQMYQDRRNTGTRTGRDEWKGN
jgi:outer membrane protein assembly factor BamB